jgi:hypothetical protein
MMLQLEGGHKRNFKIGILLLLEYLNAAWAQGQLTEIRFAGLQRTHPEYLRNFLVTEVSSHLDSTQLQRDAGSTLCI